MLQDRILNSSEAPKELEEEIIVRPKTAYFSLHQDGKAGYPFKKLELKNYKARAICYNKQGGPVFVLDVEGEEYYISASLVEIIKGAKSAEL